MKYLRYPLLALVALSMLGCSTVIVRRVDMQPPKQASEPIPEERLMDVGVVVFDANIPEHYDDIVEANITPEVRTAEVNWIANYTKDYLQKTGNWGAVRAIPEPNLVVDVLITGRVLHSDGDRQALEIKVTDSRGVVWLEDVFESLGSKYSYEASIPYDQDPFQSIYRELSDRMLAYQESLTAAEILDIRSTTLVRFGKEVVPEAFSDYVIEEKDGRYRLNRMPTLDDPTMANVAELLERELVVIDTLDEYFDRFAIGMREPYRFWRESTYSEAIALREERTSSRTRLTTGVMLAILGAFAQRQSGGFTEIGGYTGVIGGAMEILGGVQDRANAKIHQERLQELGISAGQELSPVTIELENATISLQGTYREQYEQAIKYIRDSYQKELGNIPATDSSTDELNGEEATDEFIQDSE